MRAKGGGGSSPAPLETMPWGPPSPLALRPSSSGRLLLLLCVLFCFHSLPVFPLSLCLSVRPAPRLRTLLSGAFVLKSLNTRHLWCFILPMVSWAWSSAPWVDRVDGPIQPIPPLSTTGRASWWSSLLLFSPRRSSITGLCLPDGPRNHLLSGASALRGYRQVKLLLFGFRASGGVCGQVWWWPSCCASVVIGAGCIGLHALSRVFRSAP